MSDQFFGSIGKEDTIYRDEAGFDDNFKLDIDFAKVEFEETLNVSEASSIFHISYCGKPRVLKVFHNNGDPGYARDRIRDLDRSRCEIRAYCRLKQSKICDSGAVPNFYGFMLAIDPANCAPYLDAFRHDTNFPCAILIEYLPNSLTMNCVTYTTERMQKAVIGIQQIHLALVEHNDPYPKNILIVPGDQERVIWIDFDIAIVYPNDTHIENRHGSIVFETEVVESFGWLLVRLRKPAHSSIFLIR
ncbi:hypothetical protein AJ78_08162 [Emergomyces pasteurianus Ep9510]|uniref:Protein kinase domain-containing protein n=1 Tax=Emergomyces pasteurianus Ep9510 TaxID=1447872 RepID=A0A1J9P520_9EURO|nr:hypothetical protein AJ78_08162 [Emergomyces pasteurianus Ep9510]